MKRRLRPAWAAGGTIGILAAGCSAALLAAAPGRPYEREVRPLLARYCFGCHNAATKQAGVNLSSLRTEASLAAHPQAWLDVLAQVGGHLMPPAAAPQPTDAERRLIVERLEAAMDAIDARAPRNPGRAPVRRLNRAEYDNTVRDLIGLDLRPAEGFPPDDTAHGFDNAAAALTLSPILLEKYLAAAERVLEKAIVTERPLPLVEQQVEGEALPRAEVAGEAAELRLEQELDVPFAIPADGDYRFRARAWQTGAGDDPATLVLKLDGVDSHVWYLHGEGKAGLEATVPVRKGARVSLRHTWHMSLPDNRKPPDARLFLDRVEVAGPTRSLAHRRLFFVAPGPAPTEREAAKRVVSRFAGQAFRRPAEAGELERLLGLYDRARRGGKAYEEAVRLSLLSALVSPQFLFRIERGAARRDATGHLPLTDWELASRLSYFLWSSMPDEELFRLAAGGKLREPGVLRAQAQRMLADPKAAALAENFAGQWLGTRNLERAAPDPDLFPAFRPGLRQAMAAEPLLFFQAMVREDRSILEFLDADWTFANEDLARHYGIRGVAGGHMRRISLAGSPRGGVMTMAAVLTTTSHPTRTSAVKRGKWVLEEILGAPPPPPPPDVPELEVPPKGQAPATTLRARLERHRSDPKCAGCHARMDVLGLGLENFDAIGRWREQEGGNRIDASGTLPGGRTFTGPAELKRLLAGEKEAFGRGLVEKLLVYALGRGLEHHDRREVKRITRAIAQNGWRMSALVAGIVESYPFRYRQAPTVSAPATVPANRPRKP